MKLEFESNSAALPLVDHTDVDEMISDSDSPEVTKLLRDGIEAAQKGKRAEARTLLLRVTEADAKNENAWLWLASISEYPEELLVFLKNVLSINPKNERAIEWAKATETLMAKTFVQRGIDSTKNDQKEFAKQCFLQAIVYDSKSELAWLWLASVSSSPEEKMSHLQKVLSINPHNENAIASLKSAKHQMAKLLLPKANQAAIDGRREEAKKLLDEIVNDAPDFEDAWMLKAHLAESLEAKIGYFEQVLEVNSENQVAIANLESLRSFVGENKEEENFAEEAANEPVETELQPAEIEAKSEEKSSEIVSEEAIAEDVIVEEAVAEEVIAEEANADDGIAEEAFVEEAIAEEVFEDEPLEMAETEQSQEVQFEQESAEVEFVDDEPAELELEDEPIQEFSDVIDKEDLIEEAPSFEYAEQASVEYEEDNPEYNPIEEYSVTEESYEQISVEDDPDLELPVEHNEQFYSEPEAIAEDFDTIGESKEVAQQDVYAEPAETLKVEDNSVVSEEEVVDQNGSYTYEEAVDEQAFGEIQMEDVSQVSQNEQAFDEVYYRETPSEIPIENVESNSGEVQSEQTDSEPEIIVEEKVEIVPCGFCENENEPQAFACSSCKSILTLSDIEILLSHEKANKKVIQKALVKLEKEKRKKGVSDEQLKLMGLGYINLKDFRKGFDYLKEASVNDTSDVMLGSQIDVLGVRIAEIEKQAQDFKAQPKSKTILIVDDSPTVRKLISGKLEKCGHSAVCAVDGMDALAKINDVIPDLILLDITMPRMDGYQVCKLIRGNEATRDVPVVMISGKDGFFDKVRGKMAGTDNYITKPFGPETLMKTVNEYIS